MLSDDDLRRLFEAAREASARAYAPYSGFRVGAAVLSGRGEVFAGCNVENASYGLTICAERNAVFGLVASGEAPPTVLAVLVYTPTPTPTAPCGACRQVLNEFGTACEIVAVCDGAERLRTTLDRLLPDAFGPRNLG
ncbi:cytidine deaminase [Planctomyces sp. SH-PL62]|uniref:cytidine deaminase n=1 Tax=Planctomyces sp. SH-PL62 TaxID=1636152 RepID=UPI00078C3FA0|nr:cytidine deaminase [Planctomyces sp. SH-PL62]AMV38640.1 Cytidine deaminase [Planctomyces sp. SH-PL62]